MTMPVPSSIPDIVFVVDKSGSMKSTLKVHKRLQTYYKWMHDIMRELHDHAKDTDARMFVQMFGPRENSVTDLNFEVKTVQDFARLLPCPEAIAEGYKSTVSLSEYDAVSKELIAAERNLRMVGEHNIPAAIRVIAGRERMESIGAKNHTIYDSQTWSRGVSHAFQTFGITRPAVMVILTDGNLDDPKEFAKLLSTLECSPQRFPVIHLGVIGHLYEVESIAKELRSAIVSLSRQDVRFQIHDLVRMSKHADTFGSGICAAILSDVRDCAVPIPDARSLRVGRSRFVLPAAKYCRPGLLAKVFVDHPSLFEHVYEYIMNLFAKDDLSGLTSSHSAASLLYASLMAMEGVSKKNGFSLPGSYYAMRQHVADAIQKFRKGGGVYTMEQRQQILESLDDMLNRAKKNTGLDAELRNVLAKRYPTTGVCLSAPADEYGALVLQKSYQSWKDLATALVMSITCCVMDDELRKTAEEEEAGLILPDNVDDLSPDDFGSIFRVLPSLGDRGVVLSQRYAFMLVGLVLSTSGVNGYIVQLARAYAKHVDMYATLGLNPTCKLDDIFANDASDDKKEFGMGTFREAVLAIGRHRVFDGSLAELARAVFVITWLSRVARESASMTIPATRIEIVERPEAIGGMFNTTEVQAALPARYQDFRFAELVANAEIVRHEIAPDGTAVMHPVMLNNDFERTLDTVGIYYYYPKDINLAQTIAFSSATPDTVQQYLVDAIAMVMAKSLMLYKMQGVQSTLGDFIRKHSVLGNRILLRRKHRFVRVKEFVDEEISVKDVVARFGAKIGISSEIASFFINKEGITFDRQVTICNTLLDVIRQGFFSATVRYEVTAKWQGVERVLDATGIQMLNAIFKSTFDKITAQKDAEIAEYRVYTCCVSLMGCAVDDIRRPAFLAPCRHAMCVPEAIEFVRHAVSSCPFVGVKCGWCRADIVNVDALDLPVDIKERFVALTAEETPPNMWKSMCHICERRPALHPNNAECGAANPHPLDFTCIPCDERRNRRNGTLAKYQPCPSCNAEVEKIGGCNHITCDCGAHWCWGCGKEFDVSVIYTHMSTCRGWGLGED